VYEKIVDLRRGRVESGRVPAAAEDVFEEVERQANPFGRPNSERMLWANGLAAPVAEPGEQVEVVYWVGCSGSFSPEGQGVARAMIKILNHLGINYRVLGTRERCTGDPARRMGEEGLFRQCAVHNLGVLREHGVKQVITHCPHCYNTLKNEYPEVAGGPACWETQHHTQFLAEQIAVGNLKAASSSAGGVTFHDPCYLGRGNGVVAEPRAVLSGLNLSVVEMPRSGSHSFCCGAGGGSMWLDVRGTARIENQRYAEAAGTGATVVGTGCPFCKTMLEAARQDDESENPAAPRVLDVAELVAEAEGL
jgi:Fe-S oxidoreductase